MSPSAKRAGSFPRANGDHFAGCSGRDRRAAGGDGHLWHGRGFGQQAAARARNSNRARRAAQGSFAGSVGTRIQIVGVCVAAGLLLGILASRALAAIVYDATSRDPVVLVGAFAAMFLLGLLATWVPARRALAIDPAILLREE